jgi:mono/diheme cytochrome c family protein
MPPNENKKSTGKTGHNPDLSSVANSSERVVSPLEAAGMGVKPLPEPVPGLSPTPIWLVIAFGVLFFWAQVDLGKNAAGFHPKVYPPFTSYEHVLTANPKPSAVPLFESGAILYARNCSPCHQNNGQGTPGLFPPLAGSDWVNAAGADRLIHIVLYGLQGPIIVSGQEYRSVMPQWKDQMRDAEIAAVLTFIRQKKEWGNQSSGVSPDRVSALRQSDAARDTYWTAEELLRLPDGGSEKQPENP